MYPQPNPNLMQRTHGMTNTTKKRGRPLGSKNKPKRYAVSQSQLAIAKKLGINTEDFVREAIKQKVIKPIKTDWEKLAKRLQEALESQIEDYKELEEHVFTLEKEASEHVESYRRCITVISYLETKLGLNSV